MRYENVQKNLASIKERMRQIENDPERTPREKRLAMEALQVEKSKLRFQAAIELQADWRDVEAIARKSFAAKQAAAERSNKNWNFPELQYKQAQALAELKDAGISGMAGVLERVKQGGDRHTVRAYLEAAKSFLDNSHFTSSDDIVHVVLNKQKITADLERVTRSDEQRALDAEESKLSGMIGRLHDATQELKAALPPEGISVEQIAIGGMPKDVFADLGAGVTVTRRGVPESLAIETRVDLPDAWAQPEGGAE